MPLLFYFDKNLPRNEKKSHCGGGFTYIFDIMLFQLSTLMLYHGIEPFAEIAVDDDKGEDGRLQGSTKLFMLVLRDIRGLVSQYPLLQV